MRALRFIQPDVLEHQLQHAARPAAKGAASQKVGMFARLCSEVAFIFGWKPAPVMSTEVGIPHGVHDLRMRGNRFRVYENGNAIAFCESYEYQALEPVSAGDNEEYSEKTEVFATCPIPRDGYYNADFKVSLNGTKRVVFQKFVPCKA